MGGEEWDCEPPPLEKGDTAQGEKKGNNIRSPDAKRCPTRLCGPTHEVEANFPGAW